MELLNEATGACYEIAEGEHTVGRGPWLQARHGIREGVCIIAFAFVDYGQEGVERPRSITC